MMIFYLQYAFSTTWQKKNVCFTFFPKRVDGGFRLHLRLRHHPGDRGVPFVLRTTGDQKLNNSVDGCTCLNIREKKKTQNINHDKSHLNKYPRLEIEGFEPSQKWCLLYSQEEPFSCQAHSNEKIVSFQFPTKNLIICDTLTFKARKIVVQSQLLKLTVSRQFSWEQPETNSNIVSFFFGCFNELSILLKQPAVTCQKFAWSSPTCPQDRRAQWGPTWSHPGDNSWICEQDTWKKMKNHPKLWWFI